MFVKLSATRLSGNRQSQIRNRKSAIPSLTPKRCQRINLVSPERQIQRQQQYAVYREAGVNLLRACEASEEESSAKQKKHRKGDLCDHEEVSRSRATMASRERGTL